MYSSISFDKCIEICGYHSNDTELIHHPHAALGGHFIPNHLSGIHWFVLHPYSLYNHIFTK